MFSMTLSVRATISCITSSPSNLQEWLYHRKAPKYYGATDSNSTKISVYLVTMVPMLENGISTKPPLGKEQDSGTIHLQPVPHLSPSPSSFTQSLIFHPEKITTFASRMAVSPVGNMKLHLILRALETHQWKQRGLFCNFTKPRVTPKWQVHNWAWRKALSP